MMMPISVMKPKRLVSPSVRSAMARPIMAPGTLSEMAAMQTKVMSKRLKLNRIKKKMMTNANPIPIMMSGTISSFFSISPPTSAQTSWGRSICSIILPMRACSGAASTLRLPSAVTLMQRSPLRWTILVCVQAGFTSATCLRGTLRPVAVVR